MDHGADLSVAGANEPKGTAIRCPECLRVFAPAGPRQIFCSPTHRQAWHDRDKIRGRQLVPLRMASQRTRGGSRGEIEIGKRARRDAEHLERRWIAEDAAAGRMDPADYMQLRYRLGFDRP